ncbi:MAG TPA: hypothetical protein VJ625_07570 [Propionibacteriaceae bacterium]|nr:hypothetical protein [Propionibacteriaceae bacterium]
MSRQLGTAAAEEYENAEPLTIAVSQSLSRRGSGRIRHEEKITVYVSAEELLALEQARLTLRARHGMAVDRGRIVREAIAIILADLEASAEDSELVRRLSAT